MRIWAKNMTDESFEFPSICQGRAERLSTALSPALEESSDLPNFRSLGRCPQRASSQIGIDHTYNKQHLVCAHLGLDYKGSTTS